jgi:hypothetical protein
VVSGPREIWGNPPRDAVARAAQGRGSRLF